MKALTTPRHPLFPLRQAIARQRDSTVMLSRSEASPRPARQTFAASQGDHRGSSMRDKAVMLNRSEAAPRPARQTLRGVYPERSEWAQGDPVRRLRLMPITADLSAPATY